MDRSSEKRARRSSMRGGGFLCRGLLFPLYLCNPAAPLSRPLLSHMSTSSPGTPQLKQQMRAEVEARLRDMHDEDIVHKSTRLCSRAYDLAGGRAFAGARSDGRRVGKGCVSTWRSRGS